MKNNFFEPLVLDNIPYNFAIIFPVNGRDTLCIYNDRKFALKAYGYFQSNGQENKRKPSASILKNLFEIKNSDKDINFIFSENTYNDINNKDNRKSNVIFSWEGFNTKSNEEKISKLFYAHEEYIYNNFKEWIDIKEKENEECNSNKYEFNINYNNMENIERNIEERVSIIVYQGERSSSSIMKKRKMNKRTFISFLFIYIIIIIIMFSIKYIL